MKIYLSRIINKLQGEEIEIVVWPVLYNSTILSKMTTIQMGVNFQAAICTMETKEATRNKDYQLRFPM